MSEELIYRVAEEIYQKQDEIKEDIIELKDLMVQNNTKTDYLLQLIKENAVEMATISKSVISMTSNKDLITILFKNDMPDYRNEKLDILNKVGIEKFKSSYLDMKKREQVDRLINVYG